MTAALARRLGTAALTATLTVGIMLLGAGSAQAQVRQVTCTLDLGHLPAPVSVQPGERLQLVLVLPLLGTRVNVGPTQTAPTNPGEALIQGTVAGVVGLVGQLCGAAVVVQNVVTSVVPVPPVVIPTLPPVLPSQSVSLPIPGVDVGVQQPGAGQSSPPPGTTNPGNPGTTPPGTGTPPATGTPSAPVGLPGYRFEPGGRSMYDFSRTPYGVASRFGPGAAPAFRFGQQVPGYSPQFGVLDDDVADAGDVRALPVGGPGAVALPVLLAVLMLSAVAGALVRTWVLRRAV